MNYPGQRCYYYILFILIMVGCSMDKSFMKHPVNFPKAFSSKGETPLPDMWWTVFNDEHLNSFILSALQRNFSIKAGWNRLQQAQAMVKKNRAGLFPGLDWRTDHSYESNGSEGAEASNAFSHFFGVSASYEVDLWGRIRSAVDARRLNALAGIEDLKTSAITLSAEISGTWFSIIEHRGQLRLMKAQVETNIKYLKIITERFTRGQVAAADVLQQKQVIEAIRGEIHNLEWNLKTAEHQMCIYLARMPGSLDLPEITDLPVLPELPETGIPADILGQRPDVKSAWLLVESKSQSVSEALSNRYPRLSISARASLTSNRIEDILNNWLINLTASLMGPIFDGYQRKAEVELAQAVLQEKINLYAQVVLIAVKEVEDALVREAQQNRYIESLQKQYALAGQSAESILTQYLKGAEEYTRYLNAQLSYQRLERTILTAKRELILNRISLYRALAGGFTL